MRLQPPKPEYASTETYQYILKSAQLGAAKSLEHHARIDLATYLVDNAANNNLRVVDLTQLDLSKLKLLNICT